MEKRGFQNNFNIVRMLAALMVVVGHTGPIIGQDAISVFGIGLHTIGVQILFLIGGYLVSISWKRERKVGPFLFKRFLRLWPPYVVMVVIMAVITGPLLSELGIRGYFSTPWTWYLENLRFYIIYAQPGVFTNLPIPNVTNGSLWTMPVEAVLYLLTPIVIMFSEWRAKTPFYRLMGLTGVLALVNMIVYPDTDTMWVWYATDWFKAGKLMVFYVLGMLCACEEMKPVFNLQRAAVILVAFAPLAAVSHTVQMLMMQLMIPYFMMSLALDPNPLFDHFGKKYELSYGIYLYGFFFQQLAVYLMNQYGYTPGYLSVTALSLIPTVFLAWLNCILIEKPLLKLKKKVELASRVKNA